MTSAIATHRFDDFPTSTFRGELIRPGDEGYQSARLIFNMRQAEATPALIARPVDEADVAVALRYASAHDLPVAVRGGGHGFDGTAMPDGALVLDMIGFKGIEIDPETRVVRAGAGVLLGELDAAAQAHGLVVPSGTNGTTGIAGLTLGGGIGTLMRRFGATVDNLISCTMVTLDGNVVTASVTENPDLFWALRGGGGNFGVVTTFVYRAHTLDHDVMAGKILFPFEQSQEVLKSLAEWMPTAPRELGLICALLRCPPLPSVPLEMIGQPVLVLVAVYSGQLETAGPVVAHLTGLGQPLVTMIQPTPWIKANSMFAAGAIYGRRCYSRGGYLSALSLPTITVVRDAILKAPGPSAVLSLWFLGGAISEDFAEDSVAFSREGAGVFWKGISQWDIPEQDETFQAWLDETAKALPLRTNGYSNLTDDQGEAWRRGLWGSVEKLTRLRAVKAQWDPRNLFRFNKNIVPE
ncbi:MAG: FAD-binding oxidoreductase [Planctomycetaceae bacterium]|nr:FAD-binding oxidoreductase [Planctomycetaceae bacterium]